MSMLWKEEFIRYIPCETGLLGASGDVDYDYPLPGARVWASSNAVFLSVSLLSCLINGIVFMHKALTTHSY